MPSLLTLPRELRDLIYEYYLRCDGGYIYHAESQRMTQTNGNAVCHALALTCRQTASELEGQAFRLNTITFTASHSESTQEQARIHHAVVSMIASRRRLLLSQIAPTLFTREMAQSATKTYPQFTGLIDSWMAHEKMNALWALRNSFGEAPSMWDDFVRYILRLLSTHPSYCEVVRALPTRYTTPGMYDEPLQLKDAYLQPWSIVDQAELQRLADVNSMDPKTTCYYDPEMQHIYSAAAIALSFLGSCTEAQRSSVRNIVLVEDDVSVAQPECHSRGFIPFCQANTKLHVERRVSLWKTIFSVSFKTEWDYLQAPEYSAAPDFLQDDRLLAVDITQSVGKWIMETSALPSLGMPAGSYTLILDGNPILGHTSNVFRILQRDATYQAALDASYDNGTLPMPSWLDRRRHPGFAYQGLPDIVRTLSMTDGDLIRCNFDPGAHCNLEDMLEEHRGWSQGEWWGNWSKHEPRQFQTESPLPPWHVLRWQHVLP